MGFMDIWIAPFHENAFPLRRPIPDEFIAVAAYYTWEKTGKRHGFDKQHWYQAIVQLRRSAMVLG